MKYGNEYVFLSFAHLAICMHGRILLIENLLQTSLPCLISSESSERRKFSDFVGLHERLAEFGFRIKIRSSSFGEQSQNLKLIAIVSWHTNHSNYTHYTQSGQHFLVGKILKY